MFFSKSFNWSSDMSIWCSISIAWARLLWKMLSEGNAFRYFAVSFIVFGCRLFLLMFSLARAPTMKSLLSHVNAVAVEYGRITLFRWSA